MEYNQTLSQDLVTGNIMSRHRFSRARRAGFTIVELAIVLAAIGILLTGILKGQELINGAKIRAIVGRQSSLSMAWLQFVNHYGAKPGDFARADEFIANATLSPSATRGNGVVEIGESALAMEHLALAKMIRNCQQCIDGGNRGMPNAENSLTNQYGGVISIWHNGPTSPANPNAPYYALRGVPVENNANLLQIHTGPRIPSNILAEVDRKMDDGLANSGRMVFNTYDPTDDPPSNGGAPTSMACTGTTSDALTSTVAVSYLPANQGIEGNCGAGVFIRR